MSTKPTGFVALESTVISHGLPYPHNLRLALRLEEIVREGGRDAGHGRHHRRRDHRRAEPRPDRASGDRAERAQGQPPRPADCRGAQARRRDDRRHDRLGRAPRRHPGLRNRRHRRSTPDWKLRDWKLQARHPQPATGLLASVDRHFRRSARARADANHRRVRRSQGDPGSAGDAGVAGDARRDRGRVRDG